MKKVIIIGAGGHARVIADIIKCSGDEVLGFLDDKDPVQIPSLNILGKVEDADRLYHEHKALFMIGIGDNASRKRIADKFSYLPYYTAVHPSAVVASDVVIDNGSVVMAGVIINTDAQIGKHCIINTGAIIEHDNCIESFVHVSPNATLCGTVSVGALTHIGASATIKNNTIIMHNCIIGAGAVVVKSILEVGTYIGNPAKRSS